MNEKEWEQLKDALTATVIDKIETFIKQDTKKHEPWPPEHGQTVFILTAEGKIMDRMYCEAYEDRFKYGNLYPTREMAEFVRVRRKAETVEYWEKEMKLSNFKWTE